MGELYTNFRKWKQKLEHFPFGIRPINKKRENKVDGLKDWINQIHFGGTGIFSILYLNWDVGQVDIVKFSNSHFFYQEIVLRIRIHLIYIPVIPSGI